MQGCVISYGTVVFFQKSRNLSRSLLTNNNFYCATLAPTSIFDIDVHSFERNQLIVFRHDFFKSTTSCWKIKLENQHGFSPRLLISINYWKCFFVGSTVYRESTKFLWPVQNVKNDEAGLMVTSRPQFCKMAGSSSYGLEIHFPLFRDRDNRKWL